MSARAFEALDDLRCDDVRRRVSAARSLAAIARAMGAEQTVSQLFPFLAEYEDDEEEVLLEVAAQFAELGRLAADVGAARELIPYFRLLLVYEDFTVIEAALKSLRSVAALLPPNSDAIAALAAKLQSINSSRALCAASRVCAENNFAFNGRATNDLQFVLSANAANSICVVRKETAFALRFLIRTLHDQFAGSLLRKLLGDSQESVRVAAFDSIVCRALPRDYFAANWQSVVMAQCEAPNWRLRFAFARNAPSVAASLDVGGQRALLAALGRLLGDAEREVAMETVETLGRVAALFGAEPTSERLFAALRSLAARDDAELKRLIAANVPRLAPLCAGESAQKTLCELIAALMKDETAEVRVILLNHIIPLSAVYGEKQLFALFFPFLLDLLGDKNWKIRCEAVAAIAPLAERLGAAFSKSEALLKALRDRVADRVFAVRAAALGAVRALAADGDWAARCALPLLASFVACTNYHFRLNYVIGISEIAAALSESALQRECEVLLRLTRDAVPNVRYHALLALFKAYKTGESKAVAERIARALRELESDSDSDVQRVVGRSAPFAQVYARLIEQKVI